MIITAENTPAALTQLAAQQDQLTASIDALTEQLADLTVASEQQDEQTRTLARAIRETAAEQARSIAAIAKAAKGNGNGGSKPPSDGNGAQSASSAPGGKVVALKDGKAPKAGKAGGLGQAIDAEQAVTAKVTGGAVEPPSEPAETAKRKAHRWI